MVPNGNLDRKSRTAARPAQALQYLAVPVNERERWSIIPDHYSGKIVHSCREMFHLRWGNGPYMPGNGPFMHGENGRESWSIFPDHLPPPRRGRQTGQPRT